MGPRFLAKCRECGGTTSRTYAAKHDGKCKPCVTGIAPTPRNVPTRNERILESGYEAYAREEGHYDMPDYA